MRRFVNWRSEISGIRTLAAMSLLWGEPSEVEPHRCRLAHLRHSMHGACCMVHGCPACPACLTCLHMRCMHAFARMPLTECHHRTRGHLAPVFTGACRSAPPLLSGSGLPRDRAAEEAQLQCEAVRALNDRVAGLEHQLGELRGTLSERDIQMEEKCGELAAVHGKLAHADERLAATLEQLRAAKAHQLESAEESTSVAEMTDASAVEDVRE